MEHIKDILKTMEPGYDHHDVEIETLKSELIDALARVRLSHPTGICILTSLNPPKGFTSGQLGGWSVYRIVL